MRNDDVIAQLRAADPVARQDLSRIDPGALSALREGITMTTTPRKTRARRLTRRTAMIGGLAVVLVGGGTAYAAHLQHVGGLVDGLNCQQVFGEAATDDFVGGPDLTGDPIADCAVYTSRAGLPTIADPVAFTYDGILFVTPAEQVPDGAVPRATPSDAAAVRELRMSLADLVDGGYSRCFDEAGITAFAQSEVERLGLTGWTVASDGMTNGSPCAQAWLSDGGAHGITILPHRAPDPDTRSDSVGAVNTIRDALRAGITDTCVTADGARAVADAALAGLDYTPFPTTTVVDEAVPCARVDMEVGGNIQVTVYGPTTARP